MRRTAQAVAVAASLLTLSNSLGPVRASAAPAIIDNTHRMDTNNIDMWVTNHGSFASDLSTGSPGLIFPKGSGKTAVYAAGLWIGARVSGETRVALGGYSQEYVPGPMQGGTFQPDDPRFRCYRIDRGNTTSSDYLSWPVADGAPVDAEGNPLLSGDAMIWSVYNDADPGRHTNSAGSTAPLGVEVRQSTFAFNRAGPLASAVFLKFRIQNQGANTLEDAYVSVWADPDLGGAGDDLVGCDTTRSLGYCYNATNNDPKYGSAPPAVGFDFLRGPIVVVSPGVNDTLGMTSFNKYIDGTDPGSYLEVYNCMHGLHADGSPGHVNDNPSQPVTRFQVTGDPVAGTGWLDGNPSDRRMMLSTGPFTMPPGDVQEIVVALIIGQGTDRLSSITDLRTRDDAIQAFYDLNLGTPPPTTLTADLDLDPDTINLKSRAPWVSAYIEPMDEGPAAFDPGEILPASLRLAGSVRPDPKFAVVGDHDQDGIPDLSVKFSRAELDPLLSPGLTVLALTGTLATGQTIQGSDQVRVIDPPSGGLNASVAPNPLNPSAILRFETSKPGPARVTIHDASGRLVRVLLAAPLLPAGAHETAIGARGRGDEPLASGVYFFRIQAAEGGTSGRIVILK